MAKKRRKRRVRRAAKPAGRNRQVREGNLILRDTPDDKAAAKLLGEVFKEKDDVLNATDLNESFKYFSNRNRRK